MSTRFVLFEGDELAISETFRGSPEDATLELPGRLVLKGSGHLTCNRRRACLQGDEDELMVVTCKYTTRKFTESGEGTLTIESMDPMGHAKVAVEGSKYLLVEPLQDLEATFQVTTAAKSRGGGAEDTEKSYRGKAWFVAKQKLLKFA